MTINLITLKIILIKNEMNLSFLCAFLVGSAAFDMVHGIGDTETNAPTEYCAVNLLLMLYVCCLNWELLRELHLNWHCMISSSQRQTNSVHHLVWVVWVVYFSLVARPLKQFKLHRLNWKNMKCTESDGIGWHWPSKVFFFLSSCVRINYKWVNALLYFRMEECFFFLLDVAVLRN